MTNFENETMIKLNDNQYEELGITRMPLKKDNGGVASTCRCGGKLYLSNSGNDTTNCWECKQEFRYLDAIDALYPVSQVAYEPPRNDCRPRINFDASGFSIEYMAKSVNYLPDVLEKICCTYGSLSHIGKDKWKSICNEYEDDTLKKVTELLTSDEDEIEGAMKVTVTGGNIDVEPEAGRLYISIRWSGYLTIGFQGKSVNQADVIAQILSEYGFDDESVIFRLWSIISDDDTAP